MAFVGRTKRLPVAVQMSHGHLWTTGCVGRSCRTSCNCSLIHGSEPAVEVDGVLPKLRTPLRSQERGCLGLTPEDFDCVDTHRSLEGQQPRRRNRRSCELTAPPGVAAATGTRSAAFVLCVCHWREGI
jgi:hypothetical protein